MQQQFYKYLVLNGQLGIPELGAFALQYQPARLDASGSALLPPESTIHFEQKAVQADKQLFDFLCAELNIDEVSAIGRLHEYARTIAQALQENGRFHLEGIGVLQKQEEIIVFEEQVVTDILLPVIALPDGILWKEEAAADAAITTTAYHLQDANWWIYAIILLLLGIAGIAYQYL